MTRLVPRTLTGVLAFASTACSLLIGSEPEPLRCGDEGRVGAPTCDEGQICRAGECQAISDAEAHAGETGR